MKKSTLVSLVNKLDSFIAGEPCDHTGEPTTLLEQELDRCVNIIVANIDGHNLKVRIQELEAQLKEYERTNETTDPETGMPNDLLTDERASMLEPFRKAMCIIYQNPLWKMVKFNFISGNHINLWFDGGFYRAHRDECYNFLGALHARAKHRRFNAWFSQDHLNIQF